jgi:predicted RNase H-like nuclease (RuvC/YqgF family)
VIDLQSALLAAAAEAGKLQEEQQQHRSRLNDLEAVVVQQNTTISSLQDHINSLEDHVDYLDAENENLRLKLSKVSALAQQFVDIFRDD